ncbi:hypothetical protein HYFRA_00011414 [Hymenoscyphus fraxineus]|uniref:Uncharacterized protein n=1 Tax=Hymenoscyphus fraxineus TaxID=746836 RepID=A0A9N9L3D9_9HELO|nr:hypothetical protein HYFRA_00011414 [Hymenoscyphus fraxineus]
MPALIPDRITYTAHLLVRALLEDVEIYAVQGLAAGFYNAKGLIGITVSVGLNANLWVFVAPNIITKILSQEASSVSVLMYRFNTIEYAPEQGGQPFNQPASRERY